MLLPPEEASLFLSLYQHLIVFAAGRLGGIEGIADFASWRAASHAAKGVARDRLLDNIGLIDPFIEENPGEFREADLAHVLLWRHFVRGTFVVERDLASYTIFLTERAPVRAYGVLGLTTEIVDILPDPLPVPIRAILLPWNGRIICDGLISTYNIVYGPGIRAGLKEDYRRAKAEGIITSLEPGWRPEPPQPPKTPKTPAIERFLRRKCPVTLTEFRQRYGPPASLRTGAAAQEFGPRRPDGTAVLDLDTLAVYPNLIRNQILYVYAREDRIVCATVAERTSWSKADLKPPPGHTLMR
ncbi:MAG: hypothetical protein MUC88_22460 [Planctomycetes bacterium]|jgi:hypothetical protein|nr:hypothetical protein [Planctomycetota bacterium]